MGRLTPYPHQDMWRTSERMEVFRDRVGVLRALLMAGLVVVLFGGRTLYLGTCREHAPTLSSHPSEGC